MIGNDHCGTLGLSGALVPWCGRLNVASVEPDAPGLPPSDSPALAHESPARLGLQMLPVFVIGVVCSTHPSRPQQALPCPPPPRWPPTTRPVVPLCLEAPACR